MCDMAFLAELQADDRLHALVITKACLSAAEYVACLEARKSTPAIAASSEIASQIRSL